MEKLSTVQRLKYCSSKYKLRLKCKEHELQSFLVDSKRVTVPLHGLYVISSSGTHKSIVQGVKMEAPFWSTVEMHSPSK